MLHIERKVSKKELNVNFILELFLFIVKKY